MNQTVPNESRRAGRWWRLTLTAAVLVAGLGLRAAGPEDDPLRPANDVLNRWLQALGGARNIAQLRTVDSHFTLEFDTGVPAIEVELRADLHGGYRYDFEVPRFGRVTQAFDGTATWQSNAQLGFGTLTPAEHMANLVAFDFRAPLQAFSQFPQRRLLPDETIGGRRLQVMEMMEMDGTSLKWYFDPDSGLRVRVDVEASGSHVVSDFSDFRSALGAEVLEPCRIVRTVNGKVITTVVREVLYNEDVDRELFAVPRGMQESNQQIERILFYNRQFVGNEALARVKTRVTKQLVEVTTTGARIPTTVSQKRPNLMVMEQQAPGMGTAWEGYDGHVAWAWSELEGYRTMQGAELQQFLGFVDLDGPLRLSISFPLRRYLDEFEDGDRRLVGIAMATLAGPAGNLYFDTKTFALVRIETLVQTGPDGQLKITAEFSDFRKIDGVTMPFRSVVTNPAMRSVTTIESVQNNVELDDALFRPRKDQ